MNCTLFRITAHLQLALVVFSAIGCSPTQPFFVNESPDLQYYLNTASRIEYPDVDVQSLPDAVQSAPPLTVGNHDYKFWDLTLEECTQIALQNAKIFVTTGGNAETRQNVASQITSAVPDQVSTIYDVAIQQTTTQSVPLTIDGAGNRTLPRGVLRANQIGGVEDALAEFDAQASGFVNYSTTDRPRNTGLGNTVNPPISLATDVTQQAALSKRFATGGVATIREQILYNRNNVDTTGNFARATPSDYTVLVEAQVQHPLMRNRGTLINRIPVVLASLNEDIELTDFEIQLRNLVRDVEVAYWDLYVAYRNVSTSIVGRNSAQATAYFARLQFERGAGTKQEKAQAELQFYNFKLQLIPALAGSNVQGQEQFGVYGRERILRQLMGIAATDDRLIRPIDEPTLARVNYDWTELVTEMLYLAPELRRGRFIIQQRELETISAKNQILPEVNLSLLYRWVGQGDTLGPPERQGTPPPQTGSSALAALTGGNFQEGAIRLEITPPAIGARRERARIRNSQLRVQQSRAFLQEAERLFVNQMGDAVSNVAVHYQLMQTSAQAWQVAEVEVEGRLAEYERGNTNVNVVLQSQQRKADAEINYYRAVAEYNKSLNYVDYLRGTLLANSNITLREGPWNSKAYHDALERARERSAGRKLEYGVSRPEVIRRGPVGNDATARATAGGIVSDGSLIPPVDSGAIISDEAINERVFGETVLDDPMGSGLELQLQPADTPRSMPLREMGSSSGELLELPKNPSRNPAPAGEPTIQTLSHVEPASYQSDRQPSTAIGSGVARGRITDAMQNPNAGVTADAASFRPVKRTPVP